MPNQESQSIVPTPARPYLFERRFDQPSVRAPAPEKTTADPATLPRHTDAALAQAVEQARAAAYEEGVRAGREAGHRDAMASIEAATGKLLIPIGQRLEALDADTVAWREGVAAELAGMIIEAVTRLIPALAKRTATTEAERAVREALVAAAGEADLEVRVASALAEPLRGRLNDVATPSLHLVGVDGLDPNRVEVSWTRGGMVRDGAATVAIILNAFKPLARLAEAAASPTAA